MIDIARWNKTFLAHYREAGKAYNDAFNYGVSVLGAEEPTAPHYAVIGVHHLSGTENAGNHHVYCDVLDEQGNRLNNVVVGIHQKNIGQFFARVDKPANEPGCNHVLHSNVSDNTVFVSTAGYESERVQGLRSSHPDEGPGNNIGHHSFYVVWQRLQSRPPVKPEPPAVKPEPPPPAGSDEALLAIQRLLELILQNQAAQSLALKRIEELVTGKHINPAMARILQAELQRLVEQFENLLDG